MQDLFIKSQKALQEFIMKQSELVTSVHASNLACQFLLAEMVFLLPDAERRDLRGRVLSNINGSELTLQTKELVKDTLDNIIDE